VTDSNHSSW
jgi:hypothetical protein